jgi:hypothetical protein
VHLRIATGSDQDALLDAVSLFNPYAFVEIGKDGISRPGESGLCLDVFNELPNSYAPNSKYAGRVEVQVPTASGILVLSDGQGGGWEWAY